MKIQLPEFNAEAFPKVFVGNQSRHATATACTFIDERYLISAQFLNKKLYIHDLQENSIISELKIEYFPDLIDYKDGLCISANFPTLGIKDGGVSLIKIINNKLELVKHINLGPLNTHGCRLIDGKTALVTSTANDKKIVYLDLISEKIIKEFKEFEYFPKDIYIHGDQVIISSSESRPSRTPSTILKSVLYIYSKDFSDKLLELYYHGQTDAIAVRSNDIFITLQGQHKVAHFKQHVDKLEYVGNIIGFSFPHGIATYGDKLCVSNYGDNTIEIGDIDQWLTSDRYEIE